jgi:anti-anti-sigma factor
LQPKESKLKLSLETRYHGDVVVVQCHGCIVYRDEAIAFSRRVGEILADESKIILDLGGVTSIDGAGMGELILLYRWARTIGAQLIYASPRSFVRHTLGLTRLDSFLEVHSSLSAALAALQLEPEKICAQC